MKNQKFNPRQSEENSVIASANRGSDRGAVVGALAGAGLGAKLLRKYRAVGAITGGLSGAAAGSVAGRKIGAASGARHIKEARRSLTENMQVLNAKLTELESFVSPPLFIDRNGNTNESRPSNVGQNHRIPIYRLKGNSVGSPGLGRSAEGEAYFSPLREALAAKYGRGIVDALTDGELSEERCKALRDRILSQQRIAGSGCAGEPAFSSAQKRCWLAAKIGEKQTSLMSDAEINCNFLASKRRGLVELNYAPERINNFDFRSRNSTGEYSNQPDSAAVQRAYSPTQRKTGLGLAGLAAGAAGVGAGLLLRGKKSLRLNPRTIDVPTQSFGAMLVSGSAPKPIGTEQDKMMPSPEMLKRMGLPENLTPLQWRKLQIQKLRNSTSEWHAIQERINEFQSVSAALAEDGIEALIKPKKKKQTDQYGNPIDEDGNVIPRKLVDPGTRQAGVNSVASQTGNTPSGMVATTFSSIATAARKALPYLKKGGVVGSEVGVIAGGDLLGQNIHDAQEKKKKKKLQGVEQLPGNRNAAGVGQATQMSIKSVLTEFAQRKKQDSNGHVIAGGAAGAGIGAAAGALHRPGSPISHNDLQPGDKVNRRFGPGGVFQHTGVVDESGRVVHRTVGSQKIRSVKPETYGRVGKGSTFREAPGRNDFPASQRAANATKAAGTSAGKYSCVGNNCQHSTTHISSGKAHSPQLRRAGLGALAGGALAASAAAILKRRQQKNK